MQKPWYKSAVGRFRIIAFTEGISFLILMFIAMPLKYFADSPQWVKIIGWIHGILFIMYMISGYNVKTRHKWGIGITFYAIIASLIPFGPFIFDKKILRKEANLELKD